MSSRGGPDMVSTNPVCLDPACHDPTDKKEILLEDNPGAQERGTLQPLKEVLFDPSKGLVGEGHCQGDREKKEGKVFFDPVEGLVAEGRCQGDREKKEGKGVFFGWMLADIRTEGERNANRKTEGKKKRKKVSFLFVLGSLEMYSHVLPYCLDLGL
ncbi:hypothetical protein NDU88_007416 [Pleurodeles waltl]|uniref:Uncharacterized protein n=1 Tax=Pleurodeles waltl TaxID=8319 RepID=A0AAV7PLS9_PLEWA|nr:hypothetical protein NDU88_007416 [Pleurodeles waltl]